MSHQTSDFSQTVGFHNSRDAQMYVIMQTLSLRAVLHCNWSCKIWSLPADQFQLDKRPHLQGAYLKGALKPKYSRVQWNSGKSPTQILAAWIFAMLGIAVIILKLGRLSCLFLLWLLKNSLLSETSMSPTVIMTHICTPLSRDKDLNNLKVSRSFH